MGPISLLSARTGAAVNLKKGQTIKIINTHGGQIVDLWALAVESPAEYLSMSHTRAILRRLYPRTDDKLFSSKSQPILSFVQDTTPGHHGTLISACNPRRYEQLGIKGWHASCEGNYRSAVESVGLMGKAPMTAPPPFNLFMNLRIDDEGLFHLQKPTAEKNQLVGFKALEDVVIVLSACPMDQRASEEWLPKPEDVHYEIMDE